MSVSNEHLTFNDPDQDSVRRKNPHFPVYQFRLFSLPNPFANELNVSLRGGSVCELNQVSQVSCILSD